MGLKAEPEEGEGAENPGEVDEEGLSANEQSPGSSGAGSLIYMKQSVS